MGEFIVYEIDLNLSVDPIFLIIAGIYWSTLKLELESILRVVLEMMCQSDEINVDP